MAFECFWLVTLTHSYLELLWTLKLAVFMIQYICKDFVTCVSMYYLRGQNNIRMTVTAVSSLKEGEALMHLRHPSIQTFILIFLQNIFPKHFRGLFHSLPILSSVKRVLKMSWKPFRVNMRKTDIMTSGEQIR